MEQLTSDQRRLGYGLRAICDGERVVKLAVVAPGEVGPAVDPAKGVWDATYADVQVGYLVDRHGNFTPARAGFVLGDRPAGHDTAPNPELHIAWSAPAMMGDHTEAPPAKEESGDGSGEA